MAKISLIFEDAIGDAQLESYQNSKGNIYIVIYASGARDSEYSGVIELDLDTAKAFARHLNKIIKGAANEQL